MDWKYEAIGKLKNYAAKKNAFLTIPEELKRLENAATSIRSPSGVGCAVTGGGSEREDRILNNLAKRGELEQSLKAVTAWLAPVEQAMAVLSDEELTVLDLFYIHPSKGSVDRLCQQLNCEKTTVYRRRDDALRHFTTAMYGCCEI